jgi:hypothetical protein
MAKPLIIGALFSSSLCIISIVAFLVYWFFIKNPNYYVDKDDKKTSIELSETEDTLNDVKKLFIKTSTIPDDKKILLTVGVIPEFIEKDDDDHDKEYSNATIKIKLVETTETLPVPCGTGEYLDTTNNTCVPEPYPIGTSVLCESNSPKEDGVFRYDGKKVLRYYPTPPIASSWDPEWDNPTKIPDCTGYTLGDAMVERKCYVKATKCPQQDAEFKNQYGDYNVWNLDTWAHSVGTSESNCLNERKEDFKSWCGITDADIEHKWE